MSRCTALNFPDKSGTVLMALPRFSTGQRVSIASAPRPLAPGGAYSIVRKLPSSDGVARYRVKADSEPFERIIEEARLEELTHA
jgi:hypothetical protein